MKLTRLSISAASFAALTTLSLLGCGGGGTPSTNPTPTPTPGGLRGKVVYQYGNSVDPKEIHVVNLDGTGDVKLSDGNSPSLSPDAAKVFFTFPDVVSNDSVRSLYSVNIDGSGKTKLTDDSNFVVQGALTRDGSKFLYRSGNGSPAFGNTFLCLINADGTNVQKLPFGQDTYFGKPQLSPDGSKIAYFTLGNRCFVANIDGTGTVDLGPGTDPTWSSDGSRIAFTTISTPATRTQIVTIQPDGTGKQPLPGTVDTDSQASYTADGNYVVLSRTLSGKSQLVLLKTDGTFVRQLTNGSANASFPVAVVQ